MLKEFDDIEVYLEKEELSMKDALIRRDFIIKYKGNEKRVTQIQMINWPDHLSPNDENGYTAIEYIISMINESKLNLNKSPILTHCR